MILCVLYFVSKDLFNFFYEIKCLCQKKVIYYLLKDLVRGKYKKICKILYESHVK